MRSRAFILLTFAAGCAPLSEETMEEEGHHREGFKMVVEVTTPTLTRIREFHGHVGPYVVLGYRMGMLARRILESPGYFDMTVAVESPLQPPPSCLIDGIQLGSGCTTGKRSLTVEEGTIGRATFQTKAGSTVRIALRPEVPDRVGRCIEEMGVDEAGRKFLECPEEELFVVE
jgi:formylmethanofuran dehydrogenase subunit E